MTSTQNTIIQSEDDIRPSLKPLVKWSGGKKDELKHILPHVPKSYNKYIEPFVGGGALYFHLNPKSAVISDVHKELIDFYQSIKDGHAQDIYDFMKAHPNDEQTYYRVRDELPYFDILDNAKRFYYLRKTCYRGMLRYNKKGKFNIPFGRYKTFKFEDIKNVHYQRLLKNTDIFNETFQTIFDAYNDPDHFMFLDPPYDSPFSNYGYGSFNKEHHLILAHHFKNTKIKCLMVIGHSPFIQDLYKDFIVAKYQKNYRFKLHSGRIHKDNINNFHLIIKNF